MIDLRSDTVTLPTDRDARRDGRGAARRRPVRRGPERQPAAGARRRAARQGGRAVRPDGDDGQPAPAQALLLARATTSWSARRATPSGTRPAPRRPTPACSSPRPARGGLFTADELRAVMKPRGHLLFPPTTLVEVEDTHNRMGGLVWDRGRARGGRRARRASTAPRLPRRRPPAQRRRRPRRRPRRAGRAVRPRLDRALEGARLPRRLRARRHARGHRARSPATGGCSAARCARPACSPPRACTRSSTTSSGCPRTTPTRARSASGSPPSTASCSTSTRLETNIVVFRLADGAPDAATVVARARERGVLVMAFAARTVRAVTHLDVTAEDCAAARRRARGLRHGRPGLAAGGARPARCRPAGRRRRPRG